MNCLWNGAKIDQETAIQLNHRFNLTNQRKYISETEQDNCRFNCMSRTNISGKNISATSMHHSNMQSNERDSSLRRDSFG